MYYVSWINSKAIKRRKKVKTVNVNGFMSLV